MFQCFMFQVPAFTTKLLRPKELATGSLNKENYQFQISKNQGRTIFLRPGHHF